MPSALRKKARQQRLLLEIRDQARRFAIREVHDDDVDDIAADVVLSCLKKLRSRKWTKLPGNLQALVRKLTSDRIADVRRLEKVQNGLVCEFLRRSRTAEREELSPDDDWDETSIDEYQAQIMEKLPPRCRLAYYYVRVEGDSYEEAAERMHVTRRTVGKHIVQAHRLFREELRLLGIGARTTAVEEQSTQEARLSTDANFAPPYVGRQSLPAALQATEPALLLPEVSCPPALSIQQ